MMAISGYIFGCGDDTIEECFARSLFGLPFKYKEQVESIQPGTPLYLFHFQQRRLLGGFVAAKQGGFSIEPQAFGGRFPCQVRFSVVNQQQAPISESQFQSVLGNNYYTWKKFNFCLSREQVEQLDAILNWEIGCQQEPLELTLNEMETGGYPHHVWSEMSENAVGCCTALDTSLQPTGRGSCRVVATHKMSLSDLKLLFSSSQSTFEIDRELLEVGEEQRTTIYIGPLPAGSSFSARGLVRMLNMSHRGKYNFMFIENGHDVFRHCFLNMESPKHVLSVMDELHMRGWHSLFGRSKHEDLCIKVAFWKQQGIETLARLFHGEGYWHSGGASTCKEMYDNRALFFYGAGAKFACRNVPLQSPSDLELREAGVTPLSAFLNGWPDFESANEGTRDYQPLGEAACSFPDE